MLKNSLDRSLMAAPLLLGTLIAGPPAFAQEFVGDLIR